MEGVRPIVQWHHPGYGDSAHLLRLQIEDFNRTGALQLHLDLDASVFDGAARRWAVDQFLGVIQAFVEDPSRRIESFSLLTGPIRSRLLERFNSTVLMITSVLTLS